MKAGEMVIECKDVERSGGHLIFKSAPADASLRDQARSYFGQMQRSWFFFAKVMIEIRDTKDFKNYGKKSFREFCMDEYPSMEYSNVIKAISVVENWGKELDARLEEEPEYRLPAYGSCYALIREKENIPAKDFEKLRKNVFEGKLGYHKLRDHLKQIIEEKKGKADKKSEEEIEAELIEDIKGEIEHIDDEFDIEEEVKSELQEFRILTKNIQSSVEFLTKKVPTLSQMIAANRDLLTDDAISLAEGMDALMIKMDDFLKKLEEMTGE